MNVESCNVLNSQAFKHYYSNFFIIRWCIQSSKAFVAGIQESFAQQSIPHFALLSSNYFSFVRIRVAFVPIPPHHVYCPNDPIISVQNVTYMCTKVFVAGEGPLTRGCYKQDLNGYEVELCVCESQRGGYKPCNGSSRTPFWSFEPLLLVLVSLCVTSFRHWNLLHNYALACPDTFLWIRISALIERV